MATQLSTFRSIILPVETEAPRPLWSVMIPSYNCADYLRETLTCVLAQDLGLEIMQIEVVDDHSTQDDPEAVVKEVGKGRVSFYQQPQNVGYIKNFETCLQRARGHLIHLLHGDDLVRDGFYRKLQTAFEENPDIGAAFCRSIYIEPDGIWETFTTLERRTSGVLENWLEKISSGQRLLPPSIVVRRQVYEKLGGFDSRFTCAGEDWEMWVRIATTFPVWYEVLPLAEYRVRRPGSLTGNTTRKGKFSQDMILATEIVESYLSDYLPPQKAAKMIRQAKQLCAFWALEAATCALIDNNFSVFMTQVQQAFKCDTSLKTARAVVKLLLKKAL
ncbi:glycosyltransferase family 2 protein [Phormidium sp. LEGE 05292]|uniref:glycosyltransferase family 2 protein n=1 Tax=[Phormidium] sp. LEGE 05292 TaxID=767427 RepID=UPI001881F4CC|nr:glycosyltransferase family A protein [Phormidium sp. LEGE 05292]MBE9228321.1 glycosyltransferase family 2 protein [Phormidium sp. LEGE 05292]